MGVTLETGRRLQLCPKCKALPKWATPKYCGDCSKLTVQVRQCYTGKSGCVCVWCCMPNYARRQLLAYYGKKVHRDRFRRRLKIQSKNDVVYEYPNLGCWVVQGYVADEPEDFVKPWLVVFADGVLSKDRVLKFATPEAAHKAIGQDHFERLAGLR